MLRKIRTTIEKYKMISPGDIILIALSGGADSVFLTHMLLCLREQYNLTLHAVHVNHHLREDAWKDEQYTREFCEEKEIAFYAESFDCRAFAVENKYTLEEAGRIYRYGALKQKARQIGAAKIATGHNKNDVAETILFNLARGTGLSGIGIRPVNGDIIRPIIEISRVEIEKYLADNEISYITDSTNLTELYSRNIIRREIIPILDKINSSAVSNIAKFAAIAGAENEYLDSLAETFLANCSDGKIKVSELNQHHISMKRRIIRLWLKSNIIARRTEANSAFTDKLIDASISQKDIDGVLELSEKSSGKCFSVKSLDILHSFGILSITERGNISFTPCLCELLKAPDNPVNAFWVYAKPDVPLFLRRRNIGDRIYFTSVGGHKKIKDLLIEKRIPIDKRDEIPIIAQGSDVCWLRVAGKDIFADPASADYQKVYLRSFQ